MVDPLTDLKRKLDIFVNLTLLGLIVSAIFALIWGTPTAVQRVGAFWIAFVVFSFGIIRIVSNLIREAAYGRGPIVKEYEQKIGRHLQRNKLLTNTLLERYMHRGSSDYTKEEVQSFVDELDNHVTNSVASTDLIIVALATLLTGFGDMIFCFFRSAENVACTS